MVPVAGCGLRHLGLQRQGVAEQQHPQGSAAVQLLPERVRVEPEERAGRLDHAFGRTAVAAEQERQFEHALEANNADLG